MFYEPKKSLGQNFLRSERALSEIIKASDLKKGETVLEIGPGEGALTEKILESGANVIAIEKDNRLIPVLQEKFRPAISTKQLQVINGDILDIDVSPACAGRCFKLIANIPYYITGQIFRMFLEEYKQPSKMVLLVQKEVAERIIARNGKESILSVSVKIYGTPKYIYTVPSGSFFPAPNVDSAIIEISNISKKNFENRKSSTQDFEKRFFKILRAGFSHKRKTLMGNIKTSGLNMENKNLLEIFAKLNIDKSIRAEDLPIEKWTELTEEI